MSHEPDSENSRWARRDFLTSGLAAAAALQWDCSGLTGESSISIDHLPRTFSRRFGDLTANICGHSSHTVPNVKFRLNSGSWHNAGSGPPRLPPSFFVIELRPDQLRVGENTIEIGAPSAHGQAGAITRNFTYDTSLPPLPLTTEWSDALGLQVCDGIWETFQDNGVWRVRPRPGREYYDRIVLASPTFAGARRIRVDAVYRNNVGKKLPFGFGVLPLWGGRPDRPEYSPKRGWTFALSWYYSQYRGVGMEFSTKDGEKDFVWTATYRDFTLRKNVRYVLTTEIRQEVDSHGKHVRFVQRMRWEDPTGPSVAPWMELADTEGSPLVPGEFAVALIAHRCQVDFGPVTIESLDTSA